MKLLFVTGYWPTLNDPINGRFIVDQAIALQRLGYSLLIAIPLARFRPTSPPLSASEVGLDPTQASISEIMATRLPEAISKNPLSLIFNVNLAGGAMRRFLLRNQTESACSFSGVIIHGERNMGIAAPLWAPLLKVPSVLTIHGEDPVLRKLSSYAATRRAIGASSKQFNKVILVGNPLRDYTLKLGYSQDKLTVVPNGVPVSSEYSLKLRGQSGDRLCRIVSVSRLIQLKGIDFNLQALARIRRIKPELEWTYAIIGDGPESPRLKQLCRELQLCERVKFYGRLTHDETLSIVSESDIFSLPSWNEAFGIVYLEAMMRGLAVVGCLDNGPADFITHNVTGALVPPRCVSALANTLLELIEDRGRCLRLGLAARVEALNYTWENNARQTISHLS